MRIAAVDGFAEECLLIRRFDRPNEGEAIVKRHFEEFNQILGHASEDKYTGKYGDMADVLRRNPRCSLLDVDRLFRRILVSILLGNNDAHLKNFGLLYFGDQLRLSPFYDVLAAALYPEYSRTGMALQLGPGTNPGSLAAIGQSNMIALANSFGMKNAALREAAQDLGRRIEAAQGAVREAPYGSRTLKNQLADYMRKRWNGTFKQIISSTGRKS